MRYWPALVSLVCAVMVVSIAGGATQLAAVIGAAFILAHVLLFLLLVSLDPVNARTGFRRSELGDAEMDRLHEELRTMQTGTPRATDREVS